MHLKLENDKAFIYNPWRISIFDIHFLFQEKVNLSGFLQTEEKEHNTTDLWWRFYIDIKNMHEYPFMNNQKLSWTYFYGLIIQYVTQSFRLPLNCYDGRVIKCHTILSITCKLLIILLKSSMAWLYDVLYDGAMPWKGCPHYWPFVSGISRSTMYSPHKGPVIWLWCFIWCFPEQVNTVEILVIWDALALRWRHYNRNVHNIASLYFTHMWKNENIKLNNRG